MKELISTIICDGSKVTKCFVSLLLCLFLLGLTGVVSAGEFCVSNSTELQNALTGAEANGQDDLIKVQQATYVGNFTYNSSEGYSITLVGGYTSGCAGRELDPSNTVLDGGASGMVLSLINVDGGDIFLEGFTIQNGNSPSHGGGVRALTDVQNSNAGDVTITNNIITGNTASLNGGGVHAYAWSKDGNIGNITVTDNIITDNIAGRSGGGVYAYALSNPGDAGNITLIGNTVSGNNSSGTGGGIVAHSCNGSESGSAGKVTVTDNIITGNSASEGVGGGLVAVSNAGEPGAGSDDVVLTNNIIAGNTLAGGDGPTMCGGGAYVQSSGPLYSGDITLTNNTITGNTDSSSALVVGGVHFNARETCNIYNNIIWGNNGWDIDIGQQALVTNGYNNNYTNMSYPPTNSWTNSAGNIDEDPLFVDPTNADYHLQEDSPCIDTGTNSAPELPVKDFEGDPRTLDGDMNGTSTVDMGADEYVADTDGDGLPDYWEIQYFGDLAQGAGGDFDGDGLTNLQEYQAGTDPTNSDTDSDGMPDAWELQYGLDPLNSFDADADPDADGLTNLQEYQVGTNPLNPDTDFDGMPDGWEVQYALDPNNPSDADADPDADGLSNGEEHWFGTNPHNSDTDGDKISDGYEVNAGTDPTNGADTPDLPVTGGVNNLHKPDDSYWTVIDIIIRDAFVGTLPDDIDTITVTGPSGDLPYTKDDFIYLPQWRKFWLEIPGSPELGSYTVTVWSEDLTGHSTDTQTGNRTIPVPDTTTFSPAEGKTLTSSTPTFSWAPVDYTETTMYYSLEITDLSGWHIFATSRQEGLLSYTIPPGLLNSGQTYRWRVRVTDSSDWVETQNRSQNDWLTFTMAHTLTHSAIPALDPDQWGVVTWSTTTFGTNLVCTVKVIDHDGISSDGSSHLVEVRFPDLMTYRPYFLRSESPTSAYYELYVNLGGNPPQAGDYIFTVTDPAGNTGEFVDNLAVNPLAPPNEASFTPTMGSVTPDTTPTFTWDSVTNANRYRVRIFSGDGSRTIWRGYPGNLTSYRVPPGILSPDTEYRYRIEAWDAHSPLDIDNISKAPASNADNILFTTGIESVAPFIDLGSVGVETWNSEFAGAHLSFWIRVHDAQGVPGDIKSVKVALPGGAEEVLYHDVGSPYNTSTCGIYRSSSFLPIVSGTYTFSVEDREGHIYSVTEDLNPNPIGFPAETSLSPAHNTVLHDTAVDFDWADVPDVLSGDGFYRVEIYDKDYNRPYTFATTESEYHLPAGFLKEGTLYRYQITTRREFFSQNVDNGSSSPWTWYEMPTLITTPVTGGGFSPSINMENHGVYVMHVMNPGSGVSGYWLFFDVKVADEDGVPANIASVQVTYPDGTTTRYLRYDEEISPTEARYEDWEIYDNPGDIQTGTYTFMVTDFDGGVSEQAFDELAAISVLPIPTNCTPPQDSIMPGTTPIIINWDDVPGAVRYRVRIYDGWDGTVHWSDYLTESTYTIMPLILNLGTTCSYRVYAYREAAPDVDIDNVSTDQLYVSERNHFTTAADTDGDGLPDDWEIQYFGGLSQGPGGDFDGDGLTNLQEYQAVTDPTNSDTDSDGLTDGWEVENGIDPTNPDTDSDGMLDGWEVQYGLDPLDSADADEDLDGDGLTNLQEYLRGTDPTVVNNVVVVLTPPDPITIPRGGDLVVQVTIINNTDNAGTVLFATKVTLPNGNTYPASGYLFGPKEITLNPHQSKSGQLSQNIPAGAPLGTYTYQGYIGRSGVGIMDGDHFDFEVVTAPALPGPKGWETTVDQDFAE